MYNYAERAAGLYVQGVDPTSLKKPSTFSWADPAETIVRNIQDMAASADVAKKTIGVVQKVPRMLNNLDAIAMSGKGDVALDMRFGAEKRRPKILFFTPGPQGEKYRITIDSEQVFYPIGKRIYRVINDSRVKQKIREFIRKSIKKLI